MTLLADSGDEIVGHLVTDMLVKGLIVVAALAAVAIGVVVIWRRLWR
jgi:hypothetical protein